MIVTVVPPATGPPAGVMDVMTGIAGEVVVVVTGAVVATVGTLPESESLPVEDAAVDTAATVALAVGMTSEGVTVGT